MIAQTKIACTIVCAQSGQAILWRRDRLEKMLRIYLLQHWFDLSDPAPEDAIYDSGSMRRFVGIELGEDKVPDESSILNFRHLLEKHDLTKSIFDEIGSLLKEKGLLLKQGTIVDATIISAPSSTKNKSGTRDPAADEEGQGLVLRDEGARRD
jgi:transposase, IS5 family